MIKHVLTRYIFDRRKRFFSAFLLIGASLWFFEPVYIGHSASPSLLDWLLEVSGSLFLLHVIAVLAAVLLFFGATQWLSSSGILSAAKRSRLFLAYVSLGMFTAAFVIISLLFWSVMIGWFKFNGYGSANIHPFFELASSPVLLIASRLFIDWWSLCFLIFLGLSGALASKKRLLSLWLPLLWTSGLLALFKLNVSFNGLLPAEGMLLSIHANGASLLMIMSANEGAVLILWCILYRVIENGR